MKRAILIDDDMALRKALSSVLKKRGYEVYEFEEPTFCPIYADECSCSEKETCANIILTDWKMPKIGGLQFLNKKESGGCKVQNVAVMSATWKEEELQVLKKLGCKIFTKPFKMKSLVEWLDECEKTTDFSQSLSDLNWKSKES